MKNNNNKEKLRPLNTVIKSAIIFSRNQILEKYQTYKRLYDIKVINEIIYNEKSHLVALFKDFLIFDDFSEFLKRFYMLKESTNRLPKICDFYENYSKIFANYIILPESKYMYKNIQRKQKMIDNLQKLSNSKMDYNKNDNKIFNTEIYNSIMNQTRMSENKSLLNKMLENSVQSIEFLIETICKAEGNVCKSEENIVINKIENNCYPLHINSNNLFNNITNFNKNYKPKKFEKKQFDKNNVVNNFSTKIQISSSINNTQNLISAISNATLNNLIMKPASSKDKNKKSNLSLKNKN